MSVQIKKHYASFSEAIREGAKLRGQCFGLFSFNEKSCALTAGAEAVSGKLGGIDLVDAVIDGFYSYMEDGRHPFVQCPVRVNDEACAFFATLSGGVMHLNDIHRWPREAIADWLESEEEKLGFITLIEEAKESAQELVTV